jgi:DNA-binding CsgD family transcriptional regulator
MNDNRKFLALKDDLIVLLNLGMSNRTIQKALNISPSTVMNYKKIIKKSEKINNVDYTESILIETYAILQDKKLSKDFVKANMSDNFDLSNKLKQAIEDVLNIEQIMAYLTLTMKSLETFTNLYFEENVPDGYKKLILEIFSKETTSKIRSAKTAWEDYLARINNKISLLPNKKAPIDRYVLYCIEDIVDYESSNVRKNVGSTINMGTVSLINNIIENQLKPREQEILRLSFGLNTEYPVSSLKEIAEKFWASTESIRQTRNLAIVKIKKGFDIEYGIFGSNNNTQQEIIELKEKNERELLVLNNVFKNKLDVVVSKLDKLKQDLLSPNLQLRDIESLGNDLKINQLYSERQIKVLSSEIHKLNLGGRIQNTLKRAEFNKFYQVVCLQRNELFKYNQFGGKSMTELEEFMENYRLSWGTKFSDAEIQYLEACSI